MKGNVTYVLKLDQGDNLISKYKKVQSIAKDVLQEIGNYISENSTEKDIALKCIDLLKENGINETWYYNCPALVLLGQNSCFSVSGKIYTPNNENKVGSKNLITIDLSPTLNGFWGDCARSFVFEKGIINPLDYSEEFSSGLSFIKKLHQELLLSATPDMKFGDLYKKFNDMIIEAGFENLDFNGNLGHSIVSKLSDRIYIESGNSKRLSEVTMFTFEPHIKQKKHKWGFKLENIYFFNSKGFLEEL